MLPCEDEEIGHIADIADDIIEEIVGYEDDIAREGVGDIDVPEHLSLSQYDYVSRAYGTLGSPYGIACRALRA